MSWLISKALMNSLCSQEQEAASLEENFLDGEQSALLNGNNTQLAYCAPDKMTGFSRLSRFGMTYKPLTESLGEELLTLYREDFLVKTSQPQEKVSELMENDQECGEKWRGSFVKYDHDSSLWRTHQCSLLGDLQLFLETWPQWGLMRDGECWEQRMLEQTIKGTEFGLSPNGVDSFHTPNTTGLDGGSNSRKALKKREEMWPTPVHSEARQGLQIRREGKKGTQASLSTAVLTWPTPRTKGMCGGSGSWDLLNKNTTVEEARLMGAGNGGQLNPTWVEWLMGWPLGWTDLKPLEMDKSQFVPQQLGES
jgi:DNA (cytosine-5)-methyltransferase 1